MNIIYRSVCVLLCLQLSGCAGMRMYSEQRDQHGKELKAAWAGADLKGYFAVMRESPTHLNKEKQEAIAGSTNARADNALWVLADSRIGDSVTGKGSVYGLLSAELNELGDQLGSLKDKNAIDGWLVLSKQLRINRARQKVYRNLIAAEGADVQACPSDNQPNRKATQGQVAEYLSEFATLCKGEEVMLEKQNIMLLSLPQGSLRNSLDDLIEREKKYVDASKDAASQMAQYRQTQDRYAAAAIASQPGVAPSQSLLRAGEKVRAALAAIQFTNNVLAKEAVANDRIKRIDAIFKKLGTTEDPGKNATRSELAAVLVTRIADDAQVLADLHKPMIPMSLLIQRDLEKNRADLARVQADIYRQDLELRRAILASKMTEATYLIRARALLDGIKPCYRGMIFLDAVALPAARTNPPCDDPDSRAALYDAAGRYGHAIGALRARTQGLEQRRSDLEYERSLAYNQANAEQWAVLIDATAGQSVAAAASGQKASDYKDVIQLISLLWIGQGVNK